MEFEARSRSGRLCYGAVIIMKIALRLGRRREIEGRMREVKAAIDLIDHKIDDLRQAETERADAGS
jgi:hypothetical protein